MNGNNEDPYHSDEEKDVQHVSSGELSSDDEEVQELQVQHHQSQVLTDSVVQLDQSSSPQPDSDYISFFDFNALPLQEFIERNLTLGLLAKEDDQNCHSLVVSVNSILEVLISHDARIVTPNGRYFIRETLNKLVRAFMVKDKLKSPFLESVNLFYQLVISLFIQQIQFYVDEKRVEEKKLIEKRERDKLSRSDSQSITPRDVSSTLIITEQLAKLEEPKDSKFEIKKETEDEVFIMMETIEIIMQNKNPFYLNHGSYTKEPKLLTKDIELLNKLIAENPHATWNKDCAKYVFAYPATKMHKTLSSFFIQNVNCFGNNGGYNQLMDLFENKCITLRIFKKCLRIFQKSLDGLYKVQDDLVPRVKRIIFEYIQNLDDEVLKSETWDNLKELITLTNTMLRRYQLDKSLEVTEVYLLELYFKLLNCGVVEKRLAGLNEIKSFIKQVCEDEQAAKKTSGFQQRYFSSNGTSAATSASSPNPEARTAKWHTSRTMLKWIDDKRLIDVLFHSCTHIELIRQVKPILLFISETRGFRPSDIEIIWKSSVGKHETVQRAIYDLIISIMPHINLATTNLFFDQVESITDYTKLSEHTLEFIKIFIIEAVTHLKKSKDKKRKWFGLGIFWGVLVNESKLDPKVTQKAYECLKDLVSRDDFEPQRKNILKACLDAISDHKSVPHALSLMKTIIKTYPVSKKKKKASVWGVIEYLNERVKLYDVLYADLQFACDQFAKIQAAEVEEQSKSKKDSKKPRLQETEHQIKSKVDSHVSDMEIRLDFLHFIMRHSSLVLSFSHVLAIWNLLHTKLIYQDSCCTWLESLMSFVVGADDFEVFADGTIEKIFDQIILKQIEIETMTPAALSVFHTYFVAINVKNKFMEVEYEEEIYHVPEPVPPPTSVQEDRLGLGRVGEKLFRSKIGTVMQHINREKPQVRLVEKKRSVKKYIVLQAELIGLDHLWEIVLRATDATVGQRAIQYLNNYRSEFSRNMKAASGEFREAHINSCLNKLSSISTDTSKLKEQKIIRCLDVLLDYVYLFAEKTGVRGHGISSTGIPIRLRVHHTGANPFTITLQSSDNVSRLYNTISTELNHPTYLLEVYSNGVEIENDGRIIEEIGLRDHQTMIVRKVNVKDVGMSLIKYQLKAMGLDVLANALMKQSIESHQHNMRSNSEDFDVAAFVSPSNVDDMDLDKYVLLFTEDEKTYPTNILSRDENFMKLMSLLDIGGVVAHKIWLLLLHLPTNAKLSQLIQDIAKADLKEQIDWCAILPSDGSVYKFLYSLQIIDVCLKKQAKVADKFSIDAWNEKFVKFGGLNHLVNALPTYNNTRDIHYFAQTPLHKECLSLILKLINRFLPEYINSPLVQDRLPISSILESIMKIVPASILVESQSDSPTIEQFDDLSPVSKRPTSKKYQFNQGFLNMIVGKNKYNPADRALIEEMMNILYTVLSINADTIVTICSNESFLNFLTTALLSCPEKEIRVEVASGIERLLISNEIEASLELNNKKAEGKIILIPLLLSFLAKVGEYESSCEQYFVLLKRLLLDYQKVKKNNPMQTQIFDEKQALSDTVKMVLRRPNVEERASSQEDKVLIGLLDIATVLLKLTPDSKPAIGSQNGAGLVHEIFHACLFQLPNATKLRDDSILPPKCKTIGSRTAAFELLVELADGCPENYSELIDLVAVYLSKCERHSTWRFNTESMERSELGFVGLTNLGATCYMNSLMQQLFMTVPLRKGLFSVHLDNPNDENSWLLFQMQTMFGFLQNSAKRFYDTRPFCNAYKEDGHPVNCSQQQDATEFFNLFLDKIESALKNTAQEHLLKKVFGGRTLSQLIYENQVSETYEPFLIMPLEIKDKKTLTDCLDLYVAGETLDGNNKYYSETLQRHVEALKRAVVKDLPNVLIFQLKRFEFDFNKMKHVKLNDRCEFPLDLNMEPYTEEGMERREQRKLKEKPPQHRDPSYYAYKLVGVVVHSGSADSGHYYSYIMDRSVVSENPQWFEFNDTKISVFQIDDLEKQTFGGIEEIIVKDQGKNTIRNKMYRSNNAYMLFYQRASTMYDSTFEEEIYDPRTDTDDHVVQSINEQRRSLTGPISIDAISPSKMLKDTEILEDDEDHLNEEKEEEKPSCWQSKSILALRFLVKMSAAARRKEVEEQKQIDMPLAVRKAVWNDNSKFFHDRNVFNESFDAFMWHLLNTQAGSPDIISSNIQLATKYVIDILAHAKHTKELVKWLEFLRNLFLKDNKASCNWFLQTLIENGVWRSELLFKCPDTDMRMGFVSVLSECVKILTPDETYDINMRSTASIQNTLVSEQPDEDQQSVLPSTTLIRRFISSIIEMLGDARYFSSQTTELFHFLSLYAELGVKERKFLVEKGVISMIVQLLNGDHPDASKDFSFNKRMKSSGLSGMFGTAAVCHMLHLVSLLVITCETSTTKQQNRPSPIMLRDATDTPIDLPIKDRDRLFHREFFACMIHDESNQTAVEKILIHWCWENMHVSTNFTDLIIKELPFCTGILVSSITSVSKNHHLESVLQLLEAMMMINDSIQKARVEEILKRFMKHIQTYMRDHDPTLVCVKFLTRQAGRIEVVKNWLIQDENRDDLEKVCNHHQWKLKYNLSGTKKPATTTPAPQQDQTVSNQTQTTTTANSTTSTTTTQSEVQSDQQQ